MYHVHRNPQLLFKGSISTVVFVTFEVPDFQAKQTYHQMGGLIEKCYDCATLSSKFFCVYTLRNFCMRITPKKPVIDSFQIGAVQ